MTPQETENARDRDAEVERYRQAAITALGELQWCIEYLYGLRKADLARALAQNREQIMERAGLT
jgi:hypothetical protein